MHAKPNLTRRQVLGAGGVAGAAYFAGLGRPGGGGHGLLDAGVEPAIAATGASCVLTPEKTEGPYWVDERLNRSDVRVDTSDGSAQSGVPLALTINVYREDDDCAPESGAHVDIWHCNAGGLYSDESVEGTSGHDYLRGYQVSDSAGAVRFTTIWPGWYTGRAIHIHVRVRVLSGSTVTTNFTTQIFFDDSVSDTVMASSPYDTRGSRDTRNANDNVYGSDGSVLVMPVTGGVGSGYSGTFNVGLTGLGSSSSSSTDTSVSAKIASAHFARVNGSRALRVRLHSTEKVSATLKLVRSGKVLAHRTVSSLDGIETVRLAVKHRVAAGHARLQVTFEDASGNTKVSRRSVHVPRAG